MTLPIYLFPKAQRADLGRDRRAWFHSDSCWGSYKTPDSPQGECTGSSWRTALVPGSCWSLLFLWNKTPSASSTPLQPAQTIKYTYLVYISHQEEMKQLTSPLLIHSLSQSQGLFWSSRGAWSLLEETPVEEHTLLTTSL